MGKLLDVGKTLVIKTLSTPGLQLLDNPSHIVLNLHTVWFNYRIFDYENPIIQNKLLLKPGHVKFVH